MAEVSIDLNMVRVTNEDFVKKAEEELEKIKKKALEEHIPIIMDDTLEVIEKYLKDTKNGSSSGFYCRHRKNRRGLS